MFKLESCDGIAVISAESRLKVRVAALLNHIGVNSQQFSSIDEYRQSANGQYAMVVIQNVMTRNTLEELDSLTGFGRLVVATQTKDEHSIVSAFRNGADFYFDISESDAVLTARLGAAFRTRSQKVNPNIVAPPYKFDVQRRKVFLDDRPIALSPMEYKFAEYLFSRPEKVIAKSELMTSVWSLPRQNDTRRVDTAACQIRRKMLLGSHPSGWVLKNIRRVGFKLSASSSAFSVAA